MKTKTILKNISAIILSVCMIFDAIILQDILVVADIPNYEYDSDSNADTNPLGSTDNIFEMSIYSAKAKGSYVGKFFKKNNILYIEKESIMKMANLTDTEGSNGRLISISRKDVEDTSFKVSDYETAIFEDVTYYPFVEAMTDLCINVIYDEDLEALRVFPAKNVEPLMDIFEEIYDSDTYNMNSWRNAEILDADYSRAVAQSVTIARGFFKLPATAYDYLSGNMDYESYRAAWYNILLCKVECDFANLDSFKEEKDFLDFMESSKEVVDSLDKSNKWPTSGSFWGKIKGGSKLTGGAAGIMNDITTAVQVKDSIEALNFYYNIDNMNESIINGVELLEYAGTSDDKNFNEALNDTVEFLLGEKNIEDILLQEMNDGIIKVVAGKLEFGFCSNTGEYIVKKLDSLGEIISKEFFSGGNTPQQLDAVIQATANLEIQDVAIRGYKYYNSIYNSTNDISKKALAFNNMKDITLIYLLAGHNAWKCMEFDKDMKKAASLNINEITTYVEQLLNYGEEDFCVYQNAINTKHSIFMQYDNREQTHYFFEWDEAKADDVGGLEFSIEGRDKNGEGFLHKKVFTDIYYQQNGLVVGSIKNNASNSHSRILETYEIDGDCEIVIKACDNGKSVKKVKMQVAIGGPTEKWDGDLSQYLVKEKDGSEVYRIPLPIGSGASEGTAVSTKTVKSAFKLEQMLDAGYDVNEDYFKVPDEIVSDNDNKGENDSDANSIPKAPYEKMAILYYEDYTYEVYANPEVLYMISFDGFNYKVGHAPYIDLSDAYEQGIPYNEITEIMTLDRTLEEYREYYRTFGKNIYKDINIGDVTSTTVGQHTVQYFTYTYTQKNANSDGNLKDEIILFYIELEDGNSIQGGWNVLDNQNRPITFEEFLVEAFGHMVKVPYEN